MNMYMFDLERLCTL